MIRQITDAGIVWEPELWIFWSEFHSMWHCRYYNEAGNTCRFLVTSDKELLEAVAVLSPYKLHVSKTAAHTALDSEEAACPA